MPLAVGLFVDATINGREVADSVAVPSSALRAGNVVFVLDDQGRLDVRHVEVAHSDGDTAVITAGLEPGEQVVTSAIRNPIQGMALSRIDTSAVANNG